MMKSNGKDVAGGPSFVFLVAHTFNREDLMGHSQTRIHDFTFSLILKWLAVHLNVWCLGVHQKTRFRAAPNGMKKGLSPGSSEGIFKIVDINQNSYLCYL